MSLLDAIRRVRRPRRFDPDGDPGPPIVLAQKRVLIVYLFPNLGDVLLLAPAIKALLDGGAKRVGVIVRKSPGRILKLLDFSIKIHVLPEELQLPAEAAGHAAAWAPPEIAAAAEAFADTLAGKYDVAVDLTARADIESRRWVQAAAAPHRLGWIVDGESAEDAGLTFGTLDVRYQTERHWSRYLMLPLRCLGVDEPVFDLPWREKPAASDKADGLYGDAEGPKVLVVPGANAAEKRWPPERFAEVGGRLARELDARIVVTGAPNEAPLVRQLVVGIGGQASAFTGQDLTVLQALVQQADLVITNDTAPMHLSFLARRPTIAIFTWMSPVCWGPPYRDARFVVLNAPGTGSDAALSAWSRMVYQQAVQRLA